MIIFKCDTCGKTAPIPTMVSAPVRVRPAGWFERRGRSKSNNEISVIVCSKVCAAAYDQLELDEECGPTWLPAPVDIVPIALPLEPKRK